MSTLYDRIAGQSAERLAALSDGIFAVAMTLLVFDLRLPVEAGIHGERGLWHAIIAMGPSLAVYFMSFLMLGIIWIGQQTQLNHLARSDRDLTWIHLAFLFAVTLMPFSTRLLAEFFRFRLALVIYWANLFLLGLTLYASWGLAIRRKLVREDMPAHVPAAVCRRIQIAQGLYALGALLCILSTLWSIAFIVLVQLNYALAPRPPWRRRAEAG